MKDKLRFLLSRIPWRLILVGFGVALVVKGGTQLLFVDLPADSETVPQAAKQGMGTVVAGGVTLITALMTR